MANKDRDLSKPATGRMTSQQGPGIDMDIAQIYNGVTVGWLSQAFDMDPPRVKRMLADCPCQQKSRGGQRIYELKVASKYLVPPKVDIETYMKTVKVENLPVRLQLPYWDALHKRMKYEKEAGELFHAQDVLTTFGALFTKIRTRLQLWPDTIERQHGLPAEYYETLRKLIDALQNDLAQDVEEFARKNTTKSLAGDLEDTAMSTIRQANADVL